MDAHELEKFYYMLMPEKKTGRDGNLENEGIENSGINKDAVSAEIQKEGNKEERTNE